jgi:hypothetical protein
MVIHQPHLGVTIDISFSLLLFAILHRTVVVRRPAIAQAHISPGQMFVNVLHDLSNVSYAFFRLSAWSYYFLIPIPKFSDLIISILPAPVAFSARQRSYATLASVSERRPVRGCAVQLVSST